MTDFLAFSIFTTAVVPRCLPQTGASKAAEQHPFLFLNNLSCPPSQWGKGKHATDRTCLNYFFLLDNIFSSLFHIKCHLLFFGTSRYRYANPKMWFIHLRPSPTHSQTNWWCFDNSCTWQLRTQPRKLPGTVASCSPHRQTVTNHFLLLHKLNHVTDTAWKPHPSVAVWLVATAYKTLSD